MEHNRQEHIKEMAERVAVLVGHPVADVKRVIEMELHRNEGMTVQELENSWRMIYRTQGTLADIVKRLEPEQPALKKFSLLDGPVLTDGVPLSEEYPECEKWAAVQAEADVILKFLRWYQGDLARIAEKYVMEYFSVDTRKIEEERRAMLQKSRHANAPMLAGRSYKRPVETAARIEEHQNRHNIEQALPPPVEDVIEQEQRHMGLPPNTRPETE